MGDNQHIPVDTIAGLVAAHDGGVPLLADLLNQAVEALRDVGGAPEIRVSFSAHLQGREGFINKTKNDILPPRTSIPPNIPIRIQTLLLSQLPNLRRSHPLIVTIIPLANILSDLNTRSARAALAEGRAVRRPRQLGLAG